MWLNKRFKKLIKDYSKGVLSSYYKTVFNTIEGRKVLDDLAAYCNYNKINLDNMEFNEGRRSVVLYILDMLQKDPIDYTTGE